MKPDRLVKNDHSPGHTRRGFFRFSGVGLASGSAALLAACGGDGDGQAGGEGDFEILNGALDLEYAAVAAYSAGRDLLEGDALKLGRRLLEHEQQHADALSSAITELGGTPNKARQSYPFPDMDSQNDVLRFAHDLELTAIALYNEAIPKLSSGALRATAAQIVTTEAEHVSALLETLGQPPVPDAFVKGARKVNL